jgi:hypothetical protein
MQLTGDREMVLFGLIKVLMFAETTHSIYIGCNALRDELSEEFSENNFGNQRYCEG